ncbi:MAG: DUF4249 domain-containing protein [Crocinitomicaceae bacterium]
MKYLFGFILIFTFLSCEKVIDIPLNEADRVIVVEAILKDQPGVSFVKLSKTASVYEETTFPRVSGAEVVVTDDNGGQFVFLESTPLSGIYTHSTFVVEENTTYSLKVVSENEEVTAVSSTRSKPDIDSLTYSLEVFGFGGEEFETYLMEYHSQENGNETNHYRLKIWVNEKEVEIYYLGDDQFINGQYYEAQFFGTSPDLGDSVRIEMLEMDEVMYRYYIGLSNELDASPFSAAPSNPPTNLVGNALGYFGVFMTDTASVVIQ